MAARSTYALVHAYISNFFAKDQCAVLAWDVVTWVVGANYSESVRDQLSACAPPYLATRRNLLKNTLFGRDFGDSEEWGADGPLTFGVCGGGFR